MGFGFLHKLGDFLAMTLCATCMGKRFVAGIGTNGMWRRKLVRKASFECLYTILKAHAS